MTATLETMPAWQQPLPGFATPTVEIGASIQERFEAWNQANPWVLQAVERLADQRVSTGVERFGMKALVERLRWDWTGVHASSGGKWKINNDYTSRLARALIDRRPDLEAYIELRELRAA